MKTVFISTLNTDAFQPGVIEQIIRDEKFDVINLSSNEKPSGVPYAGVIILSNFDAKIFGATKEEMSRRLTQFGGDAERIIVCGNNIKDFYQNQLRTLWKVKKVILPASWDEQAVGQRILTALYGGFGVAPVKELILPAFDGVDLFLKCPITFQATEKKIFNFIGPSLEMRQMFRKIKTNYSRSDDPILITGDTGTGKEFVATAIHTPDGKPDEMDKFFDLNISEITESLLSSELFGHVKGAFTDAGTGREGLLEAAGNGTVFLDEIGELPVEVQVKLLRVLSNRHFRKVGEHKDKTAFLGRLIFATHRNLKKMCGEGKFREDFYYRIAGDTIEVKSLKERKGDLELLAKEFYQVWKEEKAQNLNLELDQEVFDKIVNECIAHEFPGNVRRYRAILRSCFNESREQERFDFNKLRSEINSDRNWRGGNADNRLNFSVSFDPERRSPEDFCDYAKFKQTASREYFTQLLQITDSTDELEAIAKKQRQTLYRIIPSKEERELIKLSADKNK